MVIYQWKCKLLWLNWAPTLNVEHNNQTKKFIPFAKLSNKLMEQVICTVWLNDLGARHDMVQSMWLCERRIWRMYLGRLEGIINWKFDVKEKDATLVGCFCKQRRNLPLLLLLNVGNMIIIVIVINKVYLGFQ